ncbi:MAG: Hpt domain-containing protein [Candidatus Omnitrophica bacterium]|nr:Hpt domain-containing protein [Candidatus Omnitrophota bacterium]
MSNIIDLKDAMERVQDDKELLLELFDIFQEDFPGKRNTINKAFEKGDLVSFQQIAHGMKGATGNISAKDMHQTCVALDALGKDGTLNGADVPLALLDKQYAEFQAEAARLKKEFGK